MFEATKHFGFQNIFFVLAECTVRQTALSLQHARLMVAFYSTLSLSRSEISTLTQLFTRHEIKSNQGS